MGCERACAIIGVMAGCSQLVSGWVTRCWVVELMNSFHYFPLTVDDACCILISFPSF